MSDLVSRQDAISAIVHELDMIDHVPQWVSDRLVKALRGVPSIDAVPVVRCKDCKHRPKRFEEGKGEGFNLEFPDYKCPCQCDDGWYNWMPDDNWFCGDAERKES